MKQKFYWIDAFTDRAWCGNPCAVVLATDNMADETMQMIAREMNLFCVKVIILRLRQMEINNNFKFLGYGNLNDKKKLVKSMPHPYA